MDSLFRFRVDFDGSCFDDVWHNLTAWHRTTTNTAGANRHPPQLTYRYHKWQTRIDTSLLPQQETSSATSQICKLATPKSSHGANEELYHPLERNATLEFDQTQINRTC